MSTETKVNTTKIPPTIAIIGAGPSGATMARVLQNRGFSCRVYEKELSTEARDQGGSLDMKADSGQIALQLAGVHAEFVRLARFEGQETRLMDSDGKLEFHEKSTERDEYMPEIDRGELRSILLDGLKPGTVVWGAKIQEIRPIGEGRHEIILVDGSRETFDLIVGADGAWSKVRALLSPVQPVYTGVLFIQVGLRDVDRKAPEIAEMVGHGHLFSLGNKQGVLAQRSSNAYIRTYFALRVPLEWLEGVKDLTQSPEGFKTLLRKQFVGWGANIMAILDHCDDQFVVRPIYALPVGHTWGYQAGLTLIGDSAHLMSPFSGMGANLAMLDGAELGEAISRGGDLYATVKGFETMMQARAEPEAQGAAEGINGAISEHSLEEAIAAMKRHHE